MAAAAASTVEVSSEKLGCAFMKIFKELNCFKSNCNSEGNLDLVDGSKNGMVHVSNNVNFTCCGSTGENVNDDKAYIKAEADQINISDQHASLSAFT